MREHVAYAEDKHSWMREEGIWPDGRRHLWTDAFGVVLLLSLYRETGEDAYLAQAKHVAGEVERVLGRERGYRAGEDPDDDGQYYHYLALWLFALARLGTVEPAYRERGVEVARRIHRPFVRPDLGVVWRMKEDLSGPYPGHGLGALDPFQGYVAYRLLDEEALADEIAELRLFVDRSYPRLRVTQDLGLGVMLWMTQCFPREPWARHQHRACLETLDELWTDPPGFFCRSPEAPEAKLAFANYGISLGLQAAGEHPERVEKLHAFFEDYRSGDAYDRDALTHLMACTAHGPGLFVRDAAEPAATSG